MPTTVPTDHRVPTRLGELAVSVHGDGPDTVLWPSMFIDSHSFDRLLPLLPDRRLIALDGPGLGASAPLAAPTSITGAADAADDLLDVLRTDKVITGPVDWVGNAFGGHVGYELASRGRLRSLVAISAPPEPVPPHLKRQIALLGPILRLLGPVGPVRAAILDALVTDATVADPALRAIVLDSLGRPQRRSLALALQSFITGRVDVTHLLPGLDLPCLFVAGDDRGDWSPADCARAASLAPNATSITITGARTLVPLERPAELATAMHRFWGSLG